jgi:hypothetical protein
LAPSAAHRWVECPGSVMLQQAYPDEDDIDAREGTASHFAGAEMLADRVVGVGQIAPNGVALTDEMIEAAEVYVEAVHKVAKRATALGDAGVVVERRVDIPRVHPEHCWGTPDVRTWVPGFVLHVLDYKYGHRIVEAFENWQLIAYAAGLLDEPHVRDMVRQRGDQDITLALTVVQPRAPHVDGPIRTWQCRASDIRGHVNRMQMAGEAALVTDAPTRAGSWCRDCSARHACPTLQREAAAIAQDIGSAMPFDLAPHALGVELRYLSRAAAILDARKSGLEQQAEAMLKRGEQVPFWRVVQEPGREKWTVDAEQVIALGQSLEVNLAKADSLTPNQARKAGVPADVVAAMSHRPLSAFKLVPDDGAAARRVFSSQP